MEHYVTGAVIKALREGKDLTQKELANELGVSDKAISKWETGKGLPDITLLEPLSAVLGVSVTELLAGELRVNTNRAGNMLRSRFYVCPVCGNVIHAVGQGSFHCCGVTLPPLEAEDPDEDHGICVEKMEDDWYITMDHPMTKTHHITFVAYVTADRILLQRTYPEQDCALRFPRMGFGRLYANCNHHGLFQIKLTRENLL